MLQLVLWNLLLPDPQRECYPTLQRVAEGEETLQVVVLVGKKAGFVSVGKQREKTQRRREDGGRNKCTETEYSSCFRANATTTRTLARCVCALTYTDRQAELKRHSLCSCVAFEAPSLHSPACAQMTQPGLQGWRVPCDPPSTWPEGPEREVSTRHGECKYVWSARACRTVTYFQNKIIIIGKRYLALIF